MPLHTTAPAFVTLRPIRTFRSPNQRPATTPFFRISSRNPCTASIHGLPGTGTAASWAILQDSPLATLVVTFYPIYPNYAIAEFQHTIIGRASFASLPHWLNVQTSFPPVQQ